MDQEEFTAVAKLVFPDRHVWMREDGCDALPLISAHRELTNELQKQLPALHARLYTTALEAQKLRVRQNLKKLRDDLCAKEEELATLSAKPMPKRNGKRKRECEIFALKRTVGNMKQSRTAAEKFLHDA
jgi:hypothetical protein